MTRKAMHKESNRKGNRRPVSQRRRRPRGQAMVEYSIITHFILIGGSLLLLPVFTQLFEALTKYFEGIYLMIKTGAI